MCNRKEYQKAWRETHKEYRKKWFQKNKGKYKGRVRTYNLTKLYGITEEDYNQLLLEQNNRCKICGRHQSEFKRSLAVDHCHDTKKIRGLLCHHCNQGIGEFFENILIMEKAINYIKESSN
jgi:hypothetical protein